MHFVVSFELSWQPFYDEVACVANDLRFGTSDLLFYFLLFSPFFNFCIYPFKNSNEPFNFFFFQIWSLFFLLVFVLYEIIYKIEIFFNFILIKFFSYVKFGPHSIFFWWGYLSITTKLHIWHINPDGLGPDFFTFFCCHFFFHFNYCYIFLFVFLN
jgi:hypothetical protein